MEAEKAHFSCCWRWFASCFSIFGRSLLLGKGVHLLDLRAILFANRHWYLHDKQMIPADGWSSASLAGQFSQISIQKYSILTQFFHIYRKSSLETVFSISSKSLWHLNVYLNRVAVKMGSVCVCVCVCV